MSGLPLAFGAPFVLIGLLALPLIWWLLRLTPPKPREEVFPPTAILAEMDKREETPARSPWWLTLLRLLMAAFVILALAEPIWNPQEKIARGDGPLLILLDDGWASAPDFEARKRMASQILDEAETDERPVALALASRGAEADITVGDVPTARTKLAAATPRPVLVDYRAIAARLEVSTLSAFGGIAWLSSGLDGEGSKEIAERAGEAGIAQFNYIASNLQDLQISNSLNNTPEALEVNLERAVDSEVRESSVTAFDIQNRSIASAPFQFEQGAKSAIARFELPVELRNEVARITVDGAQNAGATRLLDERFRRRRVGLISGSRADSSQPLLSPLYYISRALRPFSEVRPARDAQVDAAVDQMLEENVSTLILADIGTMPSDVRDDIEQWVNGGGMLVRFAGPRLAAADNDDLVPVELRRGGRSLGGTLTWGTPQPLAKFENDSPFAGLSVPQDVTVTRQVLAQPGVDLANRTWASLADGTPLVTAAPRGDGWVVLFHVTADAEWSNLPLSGAFVDMLRRIVAVSNGSIAADRARNSAAGARVDNAVSQEVSLAPLSIMDGFGRLGATPADTKPLALGTGAQPTVTLENPPGTYGTQDAFVALNLFNDPVGLAPFDTANLPANATISGYESGVATPFKPWLLAAALILLALDCLAVLWMGGAFRRAVRRSAEAAAAVFLASFFLLPNHEVFAQNADPAIDFENSLRTRLAYVKTGDAALDELSRKGLVGLTQFIASRTSLEPGEPVGVDIATDELAFFPLLYWPISTSGAVPNAAAMARVDAFMKKGGSVLFDTRDQINGGFGNRRVTPETARLREILQNLDIPALEPVPDRHVLTRAFYLLNVFPGRYLDGRLWVETSRERSDEVDRPARQGDGVSSIMITSNDFAAAWAVEADGSPSLPVVPPNPTQRVYAYRTGVNIIMYTLTGNYKSDQVHIPALLERLGQ
ncbi:MAG: DUF4159 domain-containing protein [Pseudomonadota bacterium]